MSKIACLECYKTEIFLIFFFLVWAQRLPPRRKYRDPDFYSNSLFVRLLVYTMFITDNDDSFYLWWKENLDKLEKFSKCYDRDFPQTFVFLFMSLLKPQLLKTVIFWL